MEVRQAINILSPRADSILSLRPTLISDLNHEQETDKKYWKRTQPRPSCEWIVCLPSWLHTLIYHASGRTRSTRPTRSERSFANIARNFQSQLWGRPVAVSSPEPSASARPRPRRPLFPPRVAPAYKSQFQRIGHNFRRTLGCHASDRRRNEGVAGLVCSSFAACDAVIPRGNHTSHGVQDRSIYGRRSKSITLSSFVHLFGNLGKT